MTGAMGNIGVNGKYILSPWAVLLAVFIFSLSFPSCGRRGDPVLVQPYDEKAGIEEKSANGEEKEKIVRPREQDENKKKPKSAVTPASPTGLRALYTGKHIVLTWEEVLKQGVRSYLIYRSSGDGYSFAGETTGPAFTDRNVRQGGTYFYRIEAAGQLKSPLSEEIKVSTEIQ